MANGLNIPQLTEGQAAPEVTTNDATAALGNALANKFDCNLTAGNVVVTLAQYRGAVLLRAINVATGGRTITLPLAEREFMLVESDSANTNDVSLILGSTTVVLSAGRIYLVRTDGTANGLVARDVGGVSEPRDISAFVPGAMGNAQLLFRSKVVRAFTLPANLVGSNVTAVTAATGSTTITIKKNGSAIATAVFSAAGTTAALTTTGGTAQSIAVGDVVTFEGPATADATLADTSIDLKGSR
jgi:hypothetical protein